MLWRYEITGADTITLHFGERIDVALVTRIQHASTLLREQLGPRLLDLVPSYTTLLLRYDLLTDDLASLLADVKAALTALPEPLHAGEPNSGNSDGNSAGDQQADIIEIPVFYDVSVGPDLDSIAARAGLSVDEVIACHCGATYNVFAIGFAPGFAYLGEVPRELAAPRLDTPRAKVPPGAVGIADTQTAIYPLASPGGWNLIGRTPLQMFDPDRERPSLLDAGQRVRFRAIGRDEYLELGGRLDDLPWGTAEGQKTARKQTESRDLVSSGPETRDLKNGDRQ